jgi:hypothetical protein
VQKRTVSVRNKIRHILAAYNADVEELFTGRGLAYLAELEVSAADRFVVDRLLEEWQEHCGRLREADRQLTAFAKKASTAEKEARQVLATFPNRWMSGWPLKDPGIPPLRPTAWRRNTQQSAGYR